MARHFKAGLALCCLFRTLMKIAVLLFGVLKDMTGCSGETLQLPDNARAQDVLLYYARTAPNFEAMVPILAIAVNQEYSGADRRLQEGDEVALLPPVSGGSQAGLPPSHENGALMSRPTPNHVQIIRAPIDTQALIQRLKRSSDGAVVVFDGVVRDNTRGRRTLYLEYEAYEDM